MGLASITTLSPGTTLLATNAHTHVQAVEVKHLNGTFWATQYHPEYTFFEMARLIQARAAPLVREGFFEARADVQTYADKMFALDKNPSSPELRKWFNVADNIIDPDIRQLEIRNWIDHLVIPSMDR